MPLWLHEGSHYTKTAVELSRVCVGGQAWDDRVVGSLARSQTVRVTGVQGKVGPSILVGKFTTNSHNAIDTHV